MDRLARLGVSVGVANGPDTQATRRLPNALSIETVVPGKWLENAHGRCYRSIVQRAAADTHGHEPLSAVLDACTVSLAGLARDPQLAELDLARTAFLDTETTGLSTGTGTYAFLIGVGRFDGPTFRVGQFFMDDPSQERAQLAEMADWVADCTALVTFNGRSFDMPLLAVRYRLHKLDVPLATVPHLDLLPVARRLWRRRLPSCALGALETHILGVARTGDVPGALIPKRYFLYQRDGDARPLAPVFQHNAVDIWSMLTLLARLARAYGEPEAVLEEAQDWLSLAREYDANRDHARTVAAYEAALARGLAAPEDEEARRFLALAAKRAGDWERAVDVWSTMVAEDRPRRLFPFEELAKYHEHRAPVREPARALELAQQARAAVEARRLHPYRGRKRALAELDHRIARLERKVAAIVPPGRPEPADDSATAGS